MDEKMLLEAIGKMMDEKLEPISTRLDSLETKIDEITEDLQEVREAQNYLIGWVDNLSKAVKTK